MTIHYLPDKVCLTEGTQVLHSRYRNLGIFTKTPSIAFCEMWSHLQSGLGNRAGRVTAWGYEEHH